MKWINGIKLIFIVGILNSCCALSLAADSGVPNSDGAFQQHKELIARKTADVRKPFRVENLAIGYEVKGEQLHFKIILDFNKDIDRSSIHFGGNMRWLVKDIDGHYKDAYPEGGEIEVIGRRLVWMSKTPAISGDQKLHLQGTLKSIGGDALDCHGRCDGNDRNAPAYDSGIYELLIEKI